MCSDNRHGLRLKEFVGLLQDILNAHGDMTVWVKSEGEWGNVDERKNVFVLFTDDMKEEWIDLMKITDKKLLLIDLDGFPSVL